MRKKFFVVMIVAVVAVCASYNIYQSQNTNTLSDLAMANVEALAGCESSSNYTGTREYQTENRCICLHCPEPEDTNCKCSSAG